MKIPWDSDLIDINYENFIDDYDYLDNSNTDDIVTEASLPHLKHGEVWLSFFPYYINNAGKTRRVIILNDEDFGLVGIRVSSVKDKAINHRYSAYISNYRKNGFTEPVYFIANNAAQIKNLSPFVKKGNLDAVNLKNAIAKFSNFKKDRYDKPFVAIDWLNYLSLKDTKHPSGNNNNNSIQTALEIEASRRANCMDIANLFHYICHQCRIEHKIIQSVYVKNEDSTPAHWYVVFNHNGSWRYIHYASGTPAEGVISGKYDTLDKAINAYSKDILHKHFGTDRTPVHHILSLEQMKIWDTMVKGKKTQKEIIASVGWNGKVGK